MCFSLILMFLVNIDISQPFQIDKYIFERKLFHILVQNNHYLQRLGQIYTGPWLRIPSIHDAKLQIVKRSERSPGSWYWYNIILQKYHHWNLLAEKEGRHYHLMSSANLQNKTTWVECSAVFSISVAPVFLLQKKLKEAALCMDTAAVSNQPSWSLLWVTRHNWDLLHQRPRLRYYLIYIYLILRLLKLKGCKPLNRYDQIWAYCQGKLMCVMICVLV